MTNKEFADYLFPNIKDWTYYEEKYLERTLKEGAMVTRFAPSPTGFVHMGSLYAAFISSVFAKQTSGVFYLRIEDTDQKRIVENGIEGILNDLNAYEINSMEDPIKGGSYGPYIQSERKEIYHAYIKRLLEEGLAYPCFCTEEELEDLRKKQEEKKERIGYYGIYAKYRNFPLEEAQKLIQKGTPYVIRFRSNGDFTKKITLKDSIKGSITFPQNDLDIVLLKQDGLPTYHFAHVIDDHLMHTTHVIRGDEWLSSYPIHAELFHALKMKSPKYAHIAPLTKKLENGTVRKLSKRYDPECSITYYEEKGIPKEVVKLYLATIMNSNFEEWYAKTKSSIEDFSFTFSKMAIGGSFFDLQKLESISKLYFSTLSKEEVYEKTLSYTKKYQKEFYELLKKHKDYSVSLFGIERDVERPRKDLSSYSDVLKYYGYMYEELFYQNPYEEVEKKYDTSFLLSYLSSYEEMFTEEEWFHHLKKCAEENGYASSGKEYKEHPDKYKGTMKDFCEVIRIALTGKNQTPNLYYLLKLLGKEKIQKRFLMFLEKYGE